jgi:hypothetical protein
LAAGRAPLLGSDTKSLERRLRNQLGIAFLLRTQAEDRTWHVKSRAMKIQPYFDQWISQSGTAWAAMALAVTEAPAPAANKGKR